MAIGEGDILFLSASVPFRAGWVEDSKPREIEEAILCIARAVFKRGGRLLFGGHPSISPLVAAVAGEYYPPDPHRRIRPVITFQSEFFRSPAFAGRVPDETWMMHRMGWSSIVWTPIVASEGSPDMAASLALMRERMLLGLDEGIGQRPPKAMIAVGGMEGVRDEAALFLQYRGQWRLPTRPPVCVFGSGGGAASRLLEPVRNWRDRLWLGNIPGPEELAILSQPSAGVRPVEQEWWSGYSQGLPQDVPFQPYAAIAQWLVDSL